MAFNVYILLDCTASMHPASMPVRKAVKCMTYLMKYIANINIQLICYKDFDDYWNVYRSHLNVNANNIDEIMRKIVLSGGGRIGYEASLTALNYVVNSDHHSHPCIIFHITDEDMRWPGEWTVDTEGTQEKHFLEKNYESTFEMKKLLEKMYNERIKLVNIHLNSSHMKNLIRMEKLASELDPYTDLIETVITNTKLDVSISSIMMNRLVSFITEPPENDNSENLFGAAVKFACANPPIEYDTVHQELELRRERAQVKYCQRIDCTTERPLDTALSFGLWHAPRKSLQYWLLNHNKKEDFALIAQEMTDMIIHGMASDNVMRETVLSCSDLAGGFYQFILSHLPDKNSFNRHMEQLKKEAPDFVSKMKIWRNARLESQSRTDRETLMNFDHHEEELRPMVEGYLYIKEDDLQPLQKRYVQQVTNTVLVNFACADARNLMRDLLLALKWTTTDIPKTNYIVVFKENSEETVKSILKDGEVLMENPVGRISMLLDSSVKFLRNSWPARWTALLGCTLDNVDPKIKEFCEKWLKRDIEEDVTLRENRILPLPPPQLLNYGFVDIVLRWKDCPSHIVSLMKRFRKYEGLFKFIDHPIRVRERVICWKRKPSRKNDDKFSDGICRRFPPQDNLAIRLKETNDEICDYFVQCSKCGVRYQVWNLHLVPGKAKNHRCPYCRVSTKEDIAPVLCTTTTFEGEENSLEIINQKRKELTFFCEKCNASFLYTSPQTSHYCEEFTVALGGKEKTLYLQSVLDFPTFQYVVAHGLGFTFEESQSWESFLASKTSFYKYLEKEDSSTVNMIKSDDRSFFQLNDDVIRELTTTNRFLGIDGTIINDEEFWRLNFITPSEDYYSSCCLCYGTWVIPNLRIHQTCFGSTICYGCLYRYLKSQMSAVVIDDGEVNCMLCNTSRVNQLSNLMKYLQSKKILDCLSPEYQDKKLITSEVRQFIQRDVVHYLQSFIPNKPISKCQRCNRYVEVSERNNEENDNCGCAMEEMDTSPLPFVCENCLNTTDDDDSIILEKLKQLCNGEAAVEFSEQERERYIKVTDHNDRISSMKVSELIILAKNFARSEDRHFDIIRVCPRCSTSITKSGNCHAMLCKQCNCKFCWVCGEESSDIYDHLDEDHNISYANMSLKNCFWVDPTPSVGLLWIH